MGRMTNKGLAGTVFAAALVFVGAFVGILAGAADAAAGETFDYRIVTRAAGPAGTSRIVALKSGDLLPSGAGFRIEVIAHAAGSLDVVFDSAQGEAVALVRGRALAAGARISLPAAEWYQLDEFVGVERLGISFSVKGGRETAEHLIRHVSSEFFHVGLERLDSPARGADAGPDQDVFDGVAMQAMAGLPKSVAPYRASLEQAATFEAAKTRGAKEAKLYKMLSPGVVLVVTDGGLGTGSIISATGQILTNWHVVGENKTVGIIFKPPFGLEIKPSDVQVGVVEKVDPVRDLALVRVVNPPAEITVLQLGEMRDIEVGSDVHAIGHPKGEAWTYTKGFISQVRPNYEWPSRMGFAHKAMVIQTQTPINPGSSGSPLITDDYKIIGMNSFKRQGEALNFAISVTDIRKFVHGAAGRPLSPISGKAACRPRRVKRDTDGDGRVDRTQVDTTCDGRVDLVIVDEDKDGVPDFAVADRDGDGKPDLRMVSTARDGRFDLWLFDSDGDGTHDLVGYDDDGDGTVDRYSRSNTG